MTRDHSNTLRISTPDGVVFGLTLAGPVVRGAAVFVDYLVILVFYNILSIAIMPVIAVMPDVGQGMMILILFVVKLLYSMTLEWFWGGKTLGKKLFRLRVVDDRGLHLRPSQVVLRNLMRSIDAMPAFYLVGGITAFFNRRNQRLGDLASGTLVVRVPVPPEIPEDLLKGNRYNSFTSHPHLEARLRQLSSPHEIMVAINALRRRETLSPEARIEVYGSIADYFREKISFPDEAVEGITDEQYLRNVVDTLCRKPKTWSS